MSDFFDQLEQRLRASAAEQHGGAAAPAPKRRAWTRRGGHRRLVVLVVALLVAGAAVPAVPALTGLWEPDVAPQAPFGTVDSQSVVGVSCDVPKRKLRAGPPVGPEFTGVLGVLARPRTAADRFPRKYLRSLGLIGLDERGIRRAGVTAAGRSFFVLAAQGMGDPPWPERCVRRAPPQMRRQLAHPRQVHEPVICTMAGGGGCGTLRDIARYGTYGSSGAVRGRATITGLAPNGVRAVRVTYGRSTETFPVHDNFFTFRVGIDVEQASSPDRIEWLMDDGTVRDVTRPKR